MNETIERLSFFFHNTNFIEFLFLPTNRIRVGQHKNIAKILTPSWPFTELRVFEFFVFAGATLRERELLNIVNRTVYFPHLNLLFIFISSGLKGIRILILFYFQPLFKYIHTYTIHYYNCCQATFDYLQFFCALLLLFCACLGYLKYNKCVLGTIILFFFLR